MAKALRRELDHRRRAELRKSLSHVHPETAKLVDQGLTEWAPGLPEDDTGSLVSDEAGKPIRWVPDKGWLEGRR